jgi:phosphoglycolate phosphatase
MVKHIIWDWNGTLVDDVHICVDILNNALAKHQIEKISIDEYRRKFFFPVARFYQMLGLPSYGPKYQALAEYYIIEYRNRFKECNLHPLAFQTLERLQAYGVSHSILTAGKQSDVEYFINYYGLDGQIHFVDGANNVEASGKDERALEHLSFLDVNCDEALLVGDTCHDWEVARLIGCKPLLFTNGHVEMERLKQWNTPTIACLSEVYDWVSN